MIEASPQVESLLAAVAVDQPAFPQPFPDSFPGFSQTTAAAMERVSEFPSPLAAQLTGIALDPYGRELAERHLDSSWSDEQRRLSLLTATTTSTNSGASGRAGGGGREVVIGSGFHAAVYAATRVLCGHPRPLVLEREDRAGGTFAMTARATFTLNSRNRGGTGGLAGDLGASLNFLPGAPLQAANLSMAEYQTNTDMAFVIRLALAQFADMVTGTRVLSATRTDSTTQDGTQFGAQVATQVGARVSLELEGLPPVLADRVLDARGLGDPAARTNCDGTVALTFAQFMRRMATSWPLRGIRRVAIVGGGDSARCAVESLLGLAPKPPMAAAALDSLDLIDWYAEGLPVTCEQWRQQIRGRYQAIGPALRPDRLGRRRLRVLNRRVDPITLPGMGLIEGRTYDLMVLCTGNQETQIGGLDLDAFDEYPLTSSITGSAGGNPVARKHYNLPIFRIGPHARLPFTTRERQDGIADIPANAVSMFRTASKTAALAATLPR